MAKRLGRLESHVVTLARSVAHLSSEMRSQSSLYQDMENMKHDLNKIKESTIYTSHDAKMTPDWEKFRGWVPSLTNPKRVNKLTRYMYMYSQSHSAKIFHLSWTKDLIRVLSFWGHVKISCKFLVVRTVCQKMVHISLLPQPVQPPNFYKKCFFFVTFIWSQSMCQPFWVKQISCSVGLAEHAI